MLKEAESIGVIMNLKGRREGISRFVSANYYRIAVGIRGASWPAVRILPNSPLDAGTNDTLGPSGKADSMRTAGDGWPAPGYSLPGIIGMDIFSYPAGNSKSESATAPDFMFLYSMVTSASSTLMGKGNCFAIQK